MDLKGRISYSRVYLRYSRLLMREYNLDDAKALCESSPGTFSLQEANSFLETNSDLQWQRPRKEFNLAIVHSESSQLIGGFEVHVTSSQNKQAEFGFWIHPEHLRKGFATEATSLMLEFGFQSLGLHRIYATCRPGNQGSIRTLLKCGFRQEGHFRDHVWIRDHWEDSLVFAILEKDARPQLSHV